VAKQPSVVIVEYLFCDLRDSHVPIGLKQSNSAWFHDPDIANTSIVVALGFKEDQSLRIFRREYKKQITVQQESGET